MAMHTIYNKRKFIYLANDWGKVSTRCQTLTISEFMPKPCTGVTETAI